MASQKNINLKVSVSSEQSEKGAVVSVSENSDGVVISKDHEKAYMRERASNWSMHNHLRSLRMQHFVTTKSSEAKHS
ncbi:hypothetical protein [Veronia pacifica]|uniref:Uncharacterized protein n=1 Tax=Veronia pacifica TaxID=1080227 RepID=A0A1C3EL45_9GAMM|nr:hypothetical protein [Veronia pacifica]ODA33956.1 hypothetical protein A8L45_07860 [Veronia pacifica]